MTVCYIAYSLLSSLNLAGSEAGSTYIHLLRRTIANLDLNVFDIRLPDLVAPSVRVTHVVAEMIRFIANSTFCHDYTSLTIN